jgi:hypothetical protein
MGYNRAGNERRARLKRRRREERRLAEKAAHQSGKGDAPKEGGLAKAAAEKTKPAAE